MRKVILTAGIAIVAVLLSAAGQTFAQEAHQAPISPRTFDEFGDLRSCDLGARLDNYAIQLQNEPRMYGYIVVYAPESANKLIRDRITDYLVNTRGISAKRLKTTYAGFHTRLTESRTQLWVVPKGGDFDVEKSEVDLEAVKGMLTEYQGFDDVDLPFDPVEEDAETGPPIGNVTYSAVNDILKAQKQSIAHVVAFNGANAVPGAWRRVAESTVSDLKRLGFDSDRFKISYGGQAKDTRIQLWILPKGETPPVKDPATEPVPAKAVQMGEFGDGDLGDTKNQLVVFNRLLAVLLKNPNLRACLIVRSEVPVPEEDASEPVVAKRDEPVEPVEPFEPDPEPADLLKLVEKWKDELAVKHKIGADRVVVLYSKAEMYHTSDIQIWIVPPGQPLPNADPQPEPSQVIKDTQRRP